MTAFDAFWLPGYTLTAETEWWTLPGEGADVRAPRLTTDDIAALAGRLQARRCAYLRSLSVYTIADRVGAAINRWLDPFSPYLHQACRLIPALTGYPEPAVRKGLAGYLASFRTEHLRRLLAEELGDPAVLDAFRPRPAAPGLARATGPTLTLHSFAGNVPGLPAQSLVAALLVKSASLGKTAADEPVFAPLFARSLAAVDPQLAACLAVTYWPGEEGGQAAEAAYAAADAVVAYGSDASIAAVRARTPPDRRFIAYGHKLSFGVLLQERLTRAALPDLAERAAYDVCRFDQQGCLSPHLFYVEEGGEADARAFGEALAAALARWDGVVPRGRLLPAERQRATDLRRQQEFRLAAGDGAGAVLGAPGGDWCVLVDPDPAFQASCLNRTVWVKPLPELGALPALLAPVRRFAQTAGVAASPDRMIEAAELLAEAGLDRVCPLGQMGDPPPTWHHDGRFNLLDFLRFTDLEPASGAGRWEYAHPTEGVLGMGRKEEGNG